VGIASLLVPPLCLACRRRSAAGAALCDRCGAELARSGPLVGSQPPGLRSLWSAARNEGPARELVAALKYRRMLRAAAAMAELIAGGAPGLDGAVLVPVPASSLRLRLRGFDPAAELALALGRLTGTSPSFCLRRQGLGRQVGRGRSERLARPPSIRPVGEAPPAAVLVDDVITTGATMAACAKALKTGGCGSVVGVTFAREL
jgi:predicted amidophosphoribosyltransferase